MDEQHILFKTAKLAKAKNWDSITTKAYIGRKENSFYDQRKGEDFIFEAFDKVLLLTTSSFDEHMYLQYYAPTQDQLNKWIRETRRVHIIINRNASGWFWEMMMADGGTDLGYSDYSGPNHGGVWDSYEDALENAFMVQLTTDLPKNTRSIKHWGNYSAIAIKNFNNK